MFSKYFSTIDDVSIFPIIGLVIFLVLFIVMVVRVYRTDKSYLDKMANIPLQNDCENNLENNDEK